jgi:hypothetical protein
MEPSSQRSHIATDNQGGAVITRSNRHTQQAVAAMMALAAILPATALAQPNRQQATGASQPASAVRIVPVSAPEGFDWGDAGIGAAAGVGLAMLAVGGGRSVANRRSHSAGASTAATG